MVKTFSVRQLTVNILSFMNENIMPNNLHCASRDIKKYKLSSKK